MNLEDVIDEFRSVLDDGPRRNPQLWSDEDITRYANSAVNEACERALLIEDRTTPAVCSIDLVIGQADYPLHPSVIKVERVSLNGRRLQPTSTERLDDEETFWQNRSGPVHRYIAGESTLTVVHKPLKVETLALDVYRLPLVPLSLDAPELEIEIKPLYHLRLMPWIYHMAYMKRDSEAFDPVRAQVFEDEFTRSFGQRPDANVQRKHRDKRPHVVRMRW